MKNIVRYLFLCIAVFALVSCVFKVTGKQEVATYRFSLFTVRAGQ